MTTPRSPQPAVRRRLRKQLLAVIDSRTTMVCLDCAGQIREVDEPFETLMGDYAAPPFHLHCRSVVVPYIAGVITEQRAMANREIQGRPAAERRKGPEGFMGSLPPPAPASAATQVARPRPSDMPSAPGARLPATYREITEWSPMLARLRRTDRARPAGRDPVLDEIARLQRFTDRPRVVSTGQLSRLLARGGRELWRGFTGPSAADHAEELRTGAYTATAGIFGAGLQFTTRRDVAALYADGGQVVRAALVGGARVLDLDELEELLKDISDRLTATQRRRFALILADPGRFAAALGYDALLLPDGDVMVFNRTALVVAR